MITTNYTNKNVIENRIRSLPNAHFLSLYGDTVSLNDFNPDLPMVIIYFHPDCDYCQTEGLEIGFHANAFKNCQLVFITFDDSLKRVEKFCLENNLFEIVHMEVLYDAWNQFETSFTNLPIPSILVYDTNRKLQKRFLGATKPETIIQEIDKIVF